MYRTTTDIKHYIITIVLVLMNHNSPSIYFIGSIREILIQGATHGTLIHALKRTVIINDGPL